MLGEDLGDSGDLRPLSSLDLVDSILNIDDQLDNYLKHLQPPLESSYPVQEPGLGLSYWGNPPAAARAAAAAGAAPGGDFQGLSAKNFLGGAHHRQPQAQQPQQLVTTGGDPGFLFQPGGPQELTAKGSTESGSTSGRGVKRSACSSPVDPPKKLENTTLQKNRLAQRRFRERQKAKVKNLHTEIEQLKAKVDALQLQNTALSSQNSILEKVLSMRDEQITGLQEEKDILLFDETDDHGSPNRKSPLVLSCLKGRQMVLTWEMIKSMNGGQLIQIWQAYVSEISDALVHAQGEDAEAVARIEALINELCTVCMRLSESNPGATAVLHAQGKIGSEADEVKSCQQTLETLDLTGEQKREITQLRRMLLPKIQRLMKERGKLNLSSSPTLPSSVVGHRISLEYLKTHQMVGRLKEILSAEHKAMVEFATTVIKKVLQPVQIAQLVVQSYPLKPDLLAIASAIAIELGEDVSIPSTGQCIESNQGGIASDGQSALVPFIFNTSCSSEAVGDTTVLNGLEMTSRNTQR